MSKVTKNIVIIGGGYAGVEALMQLSAKKLNQMCIVLISKSNFFYHNLASPRTLVQNGLNESICIPFDNVVNGKDKKFIHGNYIFTNIVVESNCYLRILRNIKYFYVDYIYFILIFETIISRAL